MLADPDGQCPKTAIALTAIFLMAKKTAAAMALAAKSLGKVFGILGRAAVKAGGKMTKKKGISVGRIASVKGTPKRLTGFTKHGINQTIARGVTPQAFLQALKYPMAITKKGSFKKSFKFKGKDAMVALNKKGRIVTSGWKKGRGRIGGLLWLGLLFQATR